MKLSTKGRYGTRALIELAAESSAGPVFVKRIAQDQEISEKYLEKIFSILKAAGIIKGQRGANGGYILARDPADITVLEIIEALEGSVAPVDCVDDVNLCKRVKFCVTRDVWVRVKDAITNTLRSITLRDLVLDYNKVKSLKPEMYYI